MTDLFGSDPFVAVEPEIRAGVEALSKATEAGVPYPFDAKQDIDLLRRVKAKYPPLDVNEMVEKFLIWCTDARPWVDEKGKPAVIRWRSRIWTWAVNDERYRAKFGHSQPVRGRRTTHHEATSDGHADDTEVLDKW